MSDLMQRLDALAIYESGGGVYKTKTLYGEAHSRIQELEADKVYLKNIQDDLVEQRDALAEAVRVRDTATEPPTEEDRVLAFMELMGGDHAWIEVSTRIFLADTHAMPKWLPLPILKENDSE
jgi:hypothetical protein